MKAKLLAVGLGFIGVLIACYLNWPEWFGFCELRPDGEGGHFCRAPYQRDVGMPLLPLSITFLAFSVLAITLTHKTFKRWVIFSVVYGLIVWALLAFIPEVGGGFGGMSFTLIDVEGFAKLYASLFGILSLAIFLIPDFWSRRKRS